MEFKEEKNRVLLLDDGIEAGELTWSSAGDSFVIFDHTYVDDFYRGQGLAKKLLEEGVKIQKRDGKKIMPLCPFVKREFTANPEVYKDIWYGYSA
ncbi:MAG: N-acetyltransferase [Lactobacillales bacterium]|nr:N-acetyltransferase [Lactobacillales bacterium]